jgi:uncharacterized protein (DUF2267 family)
MTTGHRSFDATVSKTNHLLREIEDAYGWDKESRDRSYDALRAVLQALRDRLVVDEAAHLAAQLPMLVRGLFYEGWRPAKVPLKMNREEFLSRVADQIGFEVEGGVDRLVMSVMHALQSHVTEGEWEDIRSSVPRDLATLLPA